MAEKNADNVARLTPSPSTVKSPDSDVSPGTIVPSVSVDYFPTQSNLDGDQKPNGAFPPLAAASTDASTATTLASISEECQVSHSRQSSIGNVRPPVGSRKSSSASVTFRPPRNLSLPQGNPRKTDNRRLRDSSPSPIR